MNKPEPGKRYRVTFEAECIATRLAVALVPWPWTPGLVNRFEEITGENTPKAHAWVSGNMPAEYEEIPPLYEPQAGDVVKDRLGELWVCLEGWAVRGLHFRPVRPSRYLNQQPARRAGPLQSAYGPLTLLYRYGREERDG